MNHERPRLQAEARLHTAIRDDLLRNGADELDEQTLADTLEGCTNLHEMLARIIPGPGATRPTPMACASCSTRNTSG